jgi:hypothetical protein
MKERGIQIEIHKELMYNVMQANASIGNKAEAESTRKDIVKFLFPEIKNEEEELMEKAAKVLGKYGDKLRITTEAGKKLDPLEANRRLNQK